MKKDILGFTYPFLTRNTKTKYYIYEAEYKGLDSVQYCHRDGGKCHCHSFLGLHHNYKHSIRGSDLHSLGFVLCSRYLRGINLLQNQVGGIWKPDKGTHKEDGERHNEQKVSWISLHLIKMWAFFVLFSKNIFQNTFGLLQNVYLCTREILCLGDWSESPVDILWHNL